MPPRGVKPHPKHERAAVKRGSESPEAALSATVRPKEDRPKSVVDSGTSPTVIREDAKKRRDGGGVAAAPDVRFIEVGDYRLYDTKIGQGAFGKVYLCRGPAAATGGTERMLAAKYIVFGDSASDSAAFKTALAETTKERDFLSRLKTVPYILKLESLFIKERVVESRQRGKREVILITEYCRGGDLKYGLQRIRKCFPVMRVAGAPVPSGWKGELASLVGGSYREEGNAADGEGGAGVGLLQPHAHSTQASSFTPVPEGLVRIVARQLMEALNGLKKANVLHLDIKPANILLTHPLDVATVDHLNGLSGAESSPCNLEIRLADFGFAKRPRSVDTTHASPIIEEGPPLPPAPSAAEMDVSQTSPSSPSKSTSDSDEANDDEHQEGTPKSTDRKRHRRQAQKAQTMSIPEPTQSPKTQPPPPAFAQTVRDDGGTYLYMNLERIRSKRVSFYDDLWAVGLVLYEMLTGGRPPEWPSCKDEHTHAQYLSSSPLPSFPYRPFISALAVDFVLTILNPSKQATVEDMMAHPWLSPPTQIGCQTLLFPSVGEEVPLSDFDVSYARSTLKGTSDVSSHLGDTSSLSARWSGSASSCLFSVFVDPSWEGVGADTKDVRAKVVTLLPFHIPDTLSKEFEATFDGSPNPTPLNDSIKHIQSVLNKTIRPLLQEVSETCQRSCLAGVWGVDVVRRRTLHGGQWYIAVLHDYCIKGSLLEWLDTLSTSVIANDEFVRTKLPPVIQCAQWIKDARSVVGTASPAPSSPADPDAVPFPVLPTFLHPLYFEVDSDSSLRLSLAVIVVDVIMVTIGRQPSLLQGKAGLKVRMFSARAIHSEVCRELGTTTATQLPPPFSLVSPEGGIDPVMAARVLAQVPGCIPVLKGPVSGAILEMEWSVAVIGLCLVPSLPKGRHLAALFRPGVSSGESSSSPDSLQSPTNSTALEKLSTIRDFMKLHMHSLLSPTPPRPSTANSAPRRPPPPQVTPLMAVPLDGYDMSDENISSAPSPLMQTGDAHPSDDLDAPARHPPAAGRSSDDNRVSTTSSTEKFQQPPMSTPTNPTNSPFTDKGSPATSVGTTVGFSTCPPSAMGSRHCSTFHVDPTPSCDAEQQLPPAWSALCAQGLMSAAAASALVPLVSILPVAVVTLDVEDTKDAVIEASQCLLLNILQSTWLGRPGGDVAKPTIADSSDSTLTSPTQPLESTMGGGDSSTTEITTPHLPPRQASLLIHRAELLLTVVVPFLTRPADKLQVVIQATRFAYEVLTSVGVLHGSSEMQEDEDHANARGIAAECNELAGETVRQLHRAVTMKGGLPRVFSIDMEYLLDQPIKGGGGSSRGPASSSSSMLSSAPNLAGGGGSDAHRTTSVKVGAQEATPESSACPWYYIVMMRALDIIKAAARDEIYTSKTVDFTDARDLFDLLSEEAAHDKARRLLHSSTYMDQGGASELYEVFSEEAFADLQQLETLLSDHAAAHPSVGAQNTIDRFSLDVAEYGRGGEAATPTLLSQENPSDDDVE